MDECAFAHSAGTRGLGEDTLCFAKLNGGKKFALIYAPSGTGASAAAYVDAPDCQCAVNVNIHRPKTGFDRTLPGAAPP